MFKGLWVEKHWDWEECRAIIHFGFSSMVYKEVGLEAAIERALEQIHSRGYADAYRQSGKEVVAVGVNFSSQRKAVEEWRPWNGRAKGSAAIMEDRKSRTGWSTIEYEMGLLMRTLIFFIPLTILFVFFQSNAFGQVDSEIKMLKRQLEEGFIELEKGASDQAIAVGKEALLNTDFHVEMRPLISGVRSTIKNEAFLK